MPSADFCLITGTIADTRAAQTGRR